MFNGVWCHSTSVTDASQTWYALFSCSCCTMYPTCICCTGFARTVGCVLMIDCWRWMESLCWVSPTSTPWRLCATRCTVLVQTRAPSASPSHGPLPLLLLMLSPWQRTTPSAERHVCAKQRPVTCTSHGACWCHRRPQTKSYPPANLGYVRSLFIRPARTWKRYGRPCVFALFFSTFLVFIFHFSSETGQRTKQKLARMTTKGIEANFSENRWRYFRNCLKPLM